MKKRLSSIFVFIIYILAGGIFSFIGDFILFEYINSFYIVLMISLVFFYFSLIMQITIHELGHFVFGIASGYHFQSIRFLNFMWIKKNDTIQLKNFSLVGTAGQCLLSPPEYQENFPFLLYNYGGVIFNCLSSTLFFIFFLYIHNPYIKVFMLSMTCMGITTALTNGLPLQLGIDNDAVNAKNIKSNKHALDAFYQQLKINEYISQDYRLKDINDDLFTYYTGKDYKNNICITINVEAVLKKIDEHQYQQAREMAEDILENSPQIMDIHQYILKSTILYDYLLHDIHSPDIEQIRDKKYLKYVKATQNDLSTLRIEYAYALLYLRDEKKAKKILKQFDKIVQRYPYNGEVISEKEHLSIIKEVPIE